jgi:hypothetical protein
VEARPAPGATPQASRKVRLPLRYSVPTLKRWPLGTPYPAIVADVVNFCRLPVLADACLIIDRTGVGNPVVEMVEDAFRAAAGKGGLHGHGSASVLITAGHEIGGVPGTNRWNVPKKTLVSALQVVLQGRQRAVSDALPEAAVLTRELQEFRVKITTAGNETFEAWRERSHDDLVLTVALAVRALGALRWPAVEDVPPPQRQ